jgi:predicted nucleotidyltransferase
MKRDEVIRILSAHRAELQSRYGVRRLGLFGSVARDEAGPDSDVDLLVEFDRPIGLRFFELQDFFESLLHCNVDLGTPQSLKPRMRDHVLAETIDVA